MEHPQELEVAEDAEIVERVAAIDVAKATGMVCTRVPHESDPDKRVTKVWEVKGTTKGITELAEHLVKERIERVVLESTSDYWRPFVRHEALFDRAVMKGHRLQTVAAAW